MVRGGEVVEDRAVTDQHHDDGGHGNGRVVPQGRMMVVDGPLQTKQNDQKLEQHDGGDVKTGEEHPRRLFHIVRLQRLGGDRMDIVNVLQRR